MSEHPLVSLYGETEKRAFPLVLVIGREPDDDAMMGHGVGQYKFPRKPVPFWDLAYSLVAESIGKKGMVLKKLCGERNSSPIAFADISTNPIPSKRIDKQVVRKTLTTADFIAHLKEVESRPVFERVKLAVFSGLNHPVWAERKYGEAVSEIDSAWRSKVTTVRVRFFYGTNMEAIKEAFSPHIAEAKAIVDEWLQETS
jgi:hypothetical protein